MKEEGAGRGPRLTSEADHASHLIGALAASQPAHPGRPRHLRPPEHRPTPYPPKSQHTAVGPVTCDLGWACALFGGARSATALSSQSRIGAGD